MRNPAKYSVYAVDRLRMGSDGEGIRTLILLYGCPIKCKYCINRRAWDGTGDVKMMSVDELYDKVMIDRPYILATAGGVTFGGGEPLLQSKLIKEFRELIEPEMTIFVETSLHVPFENIERIIDVVDRFYIDIKTTDAGLYHEYTGGNYKLVVNNLRKLIEIKGPEYVVVRIPVIPGCNNEEDQINSKNELQELGVEKFNLFSYIIK